jgi:hypothetical protein
MLSIDDYPVEPEPAHELGHERVADRKPYAHRRSATRFCLKNWIGLLHQCCPAVFGGVAAYPVRDITRHLFEKMSLQQVLAEIEEAPNAPRLT